LFTTPTFVLRPSCNAYTNFSLPTAVTQDVAFLNPLMNIQTNTNFIGTSSFYFQEQQHMKFQVKMHKTCQQDCFEINNNNNNTVLATPNQA